MDSRKAYNLSLNKKLMEKNKANKGKKPSTPKVKPPKKSPPAKINDDEEPLPELTTCDLCTPPQKFKYFYLLVQHMKSHTDDNFNCNHCSKVFKTQTALTNHRKAHKERSIFICFECDQQFYDLGVLEQHKLTHEEGYVPPPVQEPAPSQYPQKVTISKKVLFKPKSEYPCYPCKKMFKNANALNKHRKTHKESSIFICFECDKQFHDLNLLEAHKLLHIADKEPKIESFEVMTG